MTSTREIQHALSIALVVAMASANAAARELPVRSFTTVDGLADNRVSRIVVDSRGLLWFCTNSGLSRFDGSQFQNFDVADGLPHPIINDLLETADGDFWLASNGGGLIRFRVSSAARRYEAFAVDREPTTNRVNRIFRASDGTMWAGTDGGLFQVTTGGDGRPLFSRIALQRSGHPDEMVQVWSFALDRHGTLWIGTRFGLIRLLPGGHIVSYPVRQEFETDHVFSLLYVAEDDVLWIGHQSGLAILKPPPPSSYRVAEHSAEPLEDRAIVRAAAAGPKLQNGVEFLPRLLREAVYFSAAQPSDRLSVSDLQRSPSGAIRVLTNRGIFELSAGRFVEFEDVRLHTPAGRAGEDPEGNLWFTTAAAGVVRVARHGFITFRESDGLGRQVSTVFEDHAGELVAISQDWRVSRFDGQRFITVRANMPASARQAGWAANLRVIEDHRGDWWFTSAAGLVRFSGIRRIEDLATSVPTAYTKRDGLAQDSINRLFEDSRGDIWIASLIPGRDVLTRWDRASGRFQTYSDADGLRPFNAPSGFYEDSRHVLFITLRDGGIARYDGRFRMLSEEDGVPAGRIGGAMLDRAGRLWCWSTAGVYQVDDLATEQLRPKMIVTSKEMPSGTVGALAVDTAGRLYITTARGIARFDEVSSPVRSAAPRIASLYTTSDGLAGGEVVSAYADRSGRLWFSTSQGLSYYVPEIRSPGQAYRVRIGGVRVAGVERPMSPAGEASLSELELAPGRSQLEIAFFGISFAVGSTMSFEYRLLGAGDEWSAPSPQRSVMFSNLAPGNYTFEVRAISAAGERSPQPARAAFRVLPPVWRRWWFISLVVVVMVSGLTAFERYRVATRREISRAREQRLVELEQVRQRIAADLHDEIGSSLTQISILSEVARRQGAQTMPELSRPLSVIAMSSRELVDAMSDIVWAINPAKDHLADLTQRMRRLAADALTATNTALRLELPPPDQEIALGANLRREVFLIFKEAVNNIVKHAACDEVLVKLTVEGAVLRLELHDNGRGFDPLAPTDGHGLASLRNRASALGGTLTVASSPGRGTTVTLDLPTSPYVNS